MNVTHRKNRHWATLISRLNVLRLLWGKNKVDYYTLSFDDNCLLVPTDTYNKILGTSKYPYPRWGSSRLAWKNNGDGSINVAVMRENRKGISFQVIAITNPYKEVKVGFTKEHLLPINTPYIGGNDTSKYECTYRVQ